MLLNKKIAVVTGAANGIGKSIVEVFLKNGARVIGIDVQDGNYVYDNYEQIRLDITDSMACDNVCKQIISRYNRIDILVNCVGITRDAMMKKMTEEQFDDVVSVNMKGVWNMTRFLAPKMQECKNGSIINISSVVGVYGNIGQANYAATKAGVIGMTKSCAKEFAIKGENVRVNAVAPGYTLTDMLSSVPQNLLDKFAEQTMLKRLAEPEEIANVVLFLASDLSSYVTGEVINVNGGMRL